VCALVEFSEGALVQTIEKNRLECCWALWKVQNEAIPTVTPDWQTEKRKGLELGVKSVNVQKWAQCSQESIWDLGGGTGRWGRKSRRKSEMCRENDKEGSGWKRQSH
jgi:hypothetical protein